MVEDAERDAAAGKVIFVCISSSKPAVGMPTITPLVVNGNGPLNASGRRDVLLLVHDALLVAFCAAGIAEAWAS